MYTTTALVHYTLLHYLALTVSFTPGSTAPLLTVQKVCEQGGGACLWTISKMDCLAAELFPATVSMDTAFVTEFPTTTVETLSCKVHKLLCTCEFPTALLSIVLVEVSHTFFFFFGVPLKTWSA